MVEESQNQLCDITFEMRGLSATLLSASRGDLQDPARIIEYAAGQVDRLADQIADAISESPEKSAD